jgi:hypothetical protein
MMADRRLRSAFDLMTQGNKRDAAQLVREVLKDDRNNVDAWWMMAQLLEDEEKKVRALERVLDIKPDHKPAREKLRELRPERQTSQLGADIMTTQEVVSLDWSKLGDNTQPDSDKKKNPTPDDHRIATYGMLAVGGFIVIVVIAVLVQMALSGAFSPRIAPDEALIAYLDASGKFEFDRISELTCQQHRADVESIRQEFEPIIQAAGDAFEASVDLSGVSATVAEQTDTTANVFVSGKMIISSSVNSETIDFNTLPDADRTAAFVLEDGQWRFCEAPI